MPSPTPHEGSPGKSLSEVVRQAQNSAYEIARHAIHIRQNSDNPSEVERGAITVQAAAVEIELLLQVILDKLAASAPSEPTLSELPGG